MSKGEFIYIICYHESEKMWQPPRFINAFADYSLAEKDCAYKNRSYSRNAIPNPGYKHGRYSPWERMKIKDKNKPAEWFYIQTIRIK